MASQTGKPLWERFLSTQSRGILDNTCLAVAGGAAYVTLRQTLGELGTPLWDLGTCVRMQLDDRS